MKAFNFFRKQRGHNVPDEHYQGWESHHRADFDPSSDTLCSDPLQRQYPRGRAAHSVYGGIPYYGVPPGYPHVHPEVMLRVVPGMTMPPPGLDSRFYQSPIDMMHDPAHSYAPPTGANLPAGDAHGRSFNPHPLNTGPHPRSSSGSSDPPLSATSTVGPGWSPTRASTERRFPVATTFTLADYESLRRYDLVFLVCNTPSMNQNGKWQQCGELLTQLTRIAIQYDSDGVDIYYLNTDSERSEQTFTSEEDVQEMFQRVTPSGGFRISDKLDPLMKAYRSQLQEYIDSKPARRWLTAQTPKRAIFIVITDGNYSDGDNLKSHIVKMAQYLDEINAPDTQFGIQFVQIGEGNEFFEWLDREMYVNEKVRDIVRTDKYRGGTLDEFQLGALLLGSVSGNATS